MFVAKANNDNRQKKVIIFFAQPKHYCQNILLKLLRNLQSQR